MLYEKLNPEMRQMVDDFAERARPLSWTRRSDLLTEASTSFTDQFDAEQARLASKGFVTAVLERLDDDEVNNPHQACLFLLSLNPIHRTLAKNYLSDKPELRSMIEPELGGS